MNIEVKEQFLLWLLTFYFLVFPLIIKFISPKEIKI
jgi:hypothetical protein